MLAYAANRRRVAAPPSAPHAMLVIIVAHVALIALVMSAKMDLPARVFGPPTVVTPIPLPSPPPEAPPQADPAPTENIRPVPTPLPLLLPLPDDPIVATPSPVPVPGGNIGTGSNPGASSDPLPQPAPVRVGPRFATPSHLLRPPYPPSKLASEDEAVLKLRLSIDARGRVTVVEPVGRADPAFLQAARRHLIANWRYKPATEGGQAIASSTVITLRFELE